MSCVVVMVALDLKSMLPSSTTTSSSRLFWLGVITILVLASILRFASLATLPPAPYWEEVALGYDALSISTTGRDHHGTPFPLIAFESFGDWKPSLYFYAVAATLQFLELGVFAVRLPAAVSGVALVAAVGRVAYGFSKSRRATLLAMMVMTISPWAITFSRGGWEVNLAVALLTWGIALLMSALSLFEFSSRKKWDTRNWLELVIGLLLLVASMYAYHAARVIAPLLGMVLALFWIHQWGVKKVMMHTKQLLVLLVVPLVLLSPLLTSLDSPIVKQRFAETSIFSDGSAVLRSNQLKEESNLGFWGSLLFHRYLFMVDQVLEAAFAHTTIDFLFIHGDHNPRHSVQFIGHLYYLDAAFLFAGFYWLLIKKRGPALFLVVWIVISIVPAAVSKSAPHALRTLFALPAISLVITFGMLALYQVVVCQFRQMKWVAIGVFCVAYSLLFSQYWLYYTQVYPKDYASEWQYGYQEMIQKLVDLERRYPQATVYVSRHYGRPAMYYWFYSATDPRLVQGASSTAGKDQGEFLEFQNKHFIRTSEEIERSPALLVLEPSFDVSAIDGEKTELDRVIGLDGKVLWTLYLVEG